MSRFEVIGRPRQRGLRRHPTFGRRGGRAPFRIAITGLSTDDLGPYGQIGAHAAIGYTVTDPQGNPLTPDAVKWSASLNPAAAATFGTGANPTDFAGADGFFVYLHVTKDVVDDPDLGPITRTFAFPVRRAPGAFGALVSQLLVEDSGASTYTFAAATGTGLTWTYGLVAAPAGVTLNGATRTVAFDTDLMAPAPGAYTVRATDQYGRFIERAGAFTFGEPSIITITSSGEQDANGDLALGYTIDRDDPGVRVVVFSAAEPTPVAADFFNNSPVYNYEGTVALVAGGGPIDLDINGEFLGFVRIALLPAGGDDASVAVSAAVMLDTEGPGVGSKSPAAGATRVPTDARLTMVFSEPMKRQGTVELRNVGGAAIQSFDLASSGIWSSGDAVWSGKSTADFTEGADLCVRWSGLEDLKGNELLDNTGDTEWSFEVGQWVISGTTVVDSPNASMPIFSGTIIVIG